MLTLIPTSSPKMPEPLAQLRDEILRYAWDHADADEHQQALASMAESAQRIRALAVSASRPAPLAALADEIEECGHALETEAMRWDDGRDERAHGDRLDARRVG